MRGNKFLAHAAGIPKKIGQKEAFSEVIEHKFGKKFHTLLRIRKGFRFTDA